MNFYIDFTKDKTKSKLDNLTSISHFDFNMGYNLILIIGPMGSGKTEYAAKIYKDSLIIRKKSFKALEKLTKDGRNRANVFFIRNELDKKRFKDYPSNVIPYRGGGHDTVDGVGFASDSFDIEKIIKKNTSYGTFIIDETCFYDERLIFVLNKIASETNTLFILPTLLYNFRKEFFNNTAKLLVEYADKIYNLGAYCDFNDCLDESFLTYRYYTVNGKEIPAPYFDPLLIIGGDEEVESAIYPNYATRCSSHHYLIGKEYFFSFLKSYALLYLQGEVEPLSNEIKKLSSDVKSSSFASSIFDESKGKYDTKIINDMLELPFLAERTLITLYAEYNILGKEDFREIMNEFSLSKDYVKKILVLNEYKSIF